ncbi:hypothetical protein MMC19_006578 [Ptychographa xylographoides]|nr:hypothetical protein [Ptychographa xylographoides]
MVKMDTLLDEFLTSECTDSEFDKMMDGVQGTIVSHSNFHIDLQHMITTTDPPRFNLQLQSKRNAKDRKTGSAFGRFSKHGSQTCKKSTRTYATFLIEKGAAQPSATEMRDMWKEIAIPYKGPHDSNKGLLRAE